MAFKNTLTKCLIWLGFLFVNSAITTGLVYAGVRLGVIPTVLLFAVACYAARSCCKAYDRKPSSKRGSRCAALKHWLRSF